MDNLAELRQRKAELKVRLLAEQAELRTTWQELRKDLRPNEFMVDFAQSLFGKSGLSDSLGLSSKLQGPLRLATDLLFGSSRSKVLLNVAMPFILTHLPRLTQVVKGISFNKTKSNVYGTLRKGIAGLRSQIKRKKDVPQGESVAGDIIQPS